MSSLVGVCSTGRCRRNLTHTDTMVRGEEQMPDFDAQHVQRTRVMEFEILL